MKLSTYAKQLGISYRTASLSVSSGDQKDDLQRQVERLQTYVIAKGWKVDKIVTEIASGLNDQRPKLMALLLDKSIGVIVVEHRERLTRFGFHYIDNLLQMQGRKVEVIFPTEPKDDLVEDFIAVITSMCARLYGRRGNKNRVERLKNCIEQVATDESVQD